MLSFAMRTCYLRMGYAHSVAGLTSKSGVVVLCITRSATLPRKSRLNPE